MANGTAPVFVLYKVMNSDADAGDTCFNAFVLPNGVNPTLASVKQYVVVLDGGMHPLILFFPAVLQTLHSSLWIESFRTGRLPLACLFAGSAYSWRANLFGLSLDFVVGYSGRECFPSHQGEYPIPIAKVFEPPIQRRRHRIGSSQ